MSMTQREADATNAPKGRAPEGRFKSLALPVLAFLVLAAFLGVLVVWVPRIDLIAVVAVTLGLAAYDFFVKR
ncbi:hypothetical protein JSE7799_01847 [Jannaschia seosinensis]|uniref:Uncharacterized protein n=1 Tax=Jannaschia seosinensis TaxID=313367 RepID=A0A0M7BCY1_9RHOB|nr:hypothetical protein [Jannaschia seosinensis]CUH39126.1 hypothetical protein JSE7799_01847 [Jannaschia seosinensis]